MRPAHADGEPKTIKPYRAALASETDPALLRQVVLCSLASRVARVVLWDRLFAMRRLSFRYLLYYLR